LKEKWSNFIYL